MNSDLMRNTPNPFLSAHAANIFATSLFLQYYLLKITSKL